jgi:transposase
MAALIAGERDPAVLADMARSRMRRKIPQLREALTGHFDDHHRFLLAKMLARVDRIDTDIAALDAQIETHLAPFAPDAVRLDEFPHRAGRGRGHHRRDRRGDDQVPHPWAPLLVGEVRTRREGLGRQEQRQRVHVGLAVLRASCRPGLRIRWTSRGLAEDNSSTRQRHLSTSGRPGASLPLCRSNRPRAVLSAWIP